MMFWGGVWVLPWVPQCLRAPPGVSRWLLSHPPRVSPRSQCCLACHKKCLETLAIQCGHKKLQGKLQLFGQDFTKASLSSSDGIPFIVKKCISEIEKRALKTKVTRSPFPLLRLSRLPPNRSSPRRRHRQTRPARVWRAEARKSHVSDLALTPQTPTSETRFPPLPSPPPFP